MNNWAADHVVFKIHPVGVQEIKQIILQAKWMQFSFSKFFRDFWILEAPRALRISRYYSEV